MRISALLLCIRPVWGSMPDKYGSLDDALAHFEGFDIPGTISQRQNNPGNIVFGKWAKDHGAVGVGSRGIAVFPDAATGRAAEDANIGNYVDKGASVSDLINKWSPPGAAGNSAEINTNYIKSVAGSTGLDPSLPIRNQMASDTPVIPDSTSTSHGFLDALGTIGDIGGKVDGVLGTGFGPNGADAGPISTQLTGLFAGFSWGRTGTLIFGTMLIGGALLLFRPVQNIVTTAAKGAA